MSTTAIDRTLAQRRQALELANKVRTNRSRLKLRVAEFGPAVAVEVLTRPHPTYRGMKVRDLLLAIPAYGPRRVSRTLRRCLISDVKTIAGLSDRQRRDLIAELRGDEE